jgi:hypothetical protein
MARYTVAEAADMLGITSGAVRNRLSRGTLRSIKEDGTVYVFLPADMSRDAERDTDDTPPGMPDPESDALTSELRDRLRYIEGQLEAERQAHAEARRLLMAALERIPPQLEAPQEATGDAETVEEAREELGAERARRKTAETTLHEGMAEERRRREAAERERDDLRRELYARKEPRQSPQTVEESPDRAGPHSATGGAQKGARRPWWRRVFRG